MMKKKCARLIDYPFNGISHYEKCGRTAIYRISSGNEPEEFVCGIHFQSAKKHSERLKRRINYNNDFKYDLLTTPTSKEK